MCSNASWPEVFLALSNVAGVNLHRCDNTKKQNTQGMSDQTEAVMNLVTYLPASFNPTLIGLGGAFLAFFCDPTSPDSCALDLERSSSFATLQGVRVTRSMGASGDLASSSSPTTVLTSVPAVLTPQVFNEP
jgi:hypothetical protein